MQPLTVLFFGPQGSGKGTQVKLLIEELKKRSDRGLLYIEMGALLRGLKETGTHSAALTKEIVDNGLRMPDFMPIYLMTDILVKNFTGKEHIIADGLARGPDQTRGWDDAMVFYKREKYHIIVLKLSEESSIKRLLARGRNDDTEEAIRSRLAWNKADVMPQLELLKKRNRIIHEIDGEPDVDTIHKNILSVLGLAE